MPHPEFNIRTEPRPSARRAGVPSKRKVAIGAVLAFAGVCMLVAVAIFWAAATPTQRSHERPSSGGTLKAKPAVDDQPATTLSLARSGERIVDDPEGELLWASPTPDEPLSLAYVPAGTQCLIHLRPASLAGHQEGERMLAALGPWGRHSVQHLETILGGELNSWDSLLIAVVVGDGGELDASVRASLAPQAAEKLATRLSDGPTQRRGNVTYLVSEDWAYFFAPITSPGADRGPWLVVCPVEQAAELIDDGGDAPPLVRDIERLARTADAQRMLTVIVAPKFLQASGNDLLVNEAAPLHTALEWLIEGDATALMLSAHLGDDFFAEIRATPTLNMPPHRLADQLRRRIGEAPNAVEGIVLSEPWHPHGRRVLARLPGMLRALARYSRAGVDDDHAVVRAYLPSAAGHNLLMAAELLLTQPRAGDFVSGDVAANKQTPQSLAERLDRTTSLAFSKETLERALELLADDVGVEIVINGADLQLEGITKNQSLAIDLRDRPAREILLEILLRANPDRTAAGPADPKQKLIYTVNGGDANVPGRIIVTTRAAAERRGELAADVFLLKNR